MIYKLEVDGFKGFENKVLFDLTHRKNYEFNQECIVDGVIRKSIVYGKNGIGKSNLGLAIFDIVSHLTDFNVNKSMYFGYLNAISKKEMATFKYDFKFGDDIVTYFYGKKNISTILFEELSINGEVIASINRNESPLAFFDIEGAETLNKNMGESPISIINYIKSNAVLVESKKSKLFEKFISFVDKMLYFRSLDNNRYLGLEMGSHQIMPDIVKRGNVSDFEAFLNRAGVDCKLCVIKNQSGEDAVSIDDIAFDYGDKKIPFFAIASTGSQSLAAFYFWLQRIREDNCVSFVFIDEFDAFYHHELSMLIIDEMKKAKSQVVVTTHNTSVMTNELLRPDCYFIMEKSAITPIYEKTDKELRSAHNIEKMYKAGSFNG